MQLVEPDYEPELAEDLKVETPPNDGRGEDAPEFRSKGI